MSKRATEHLQKLLAARIEATGLHCHHDEKQKEKDKKKGY